MNKRRPGQTDCCCCCSWVRDDDSQSAVRKQRMTAEVCIRPSEKGAPKFRLLQEWASTSCFIRFDTFRNSNEVRQKEFFCSSQKKLIGLRLASSINPSSFFPSPRGKALNTLGGSSHHNVIFQSGSLALPFHHQRSHLCTAARRSKSTRCASSAAPLSKPGCRSCNGTRSRERCKGRRDERLVRTSAVDAILPLN